MKELYDPLSKEIRKSLTSATKQKYTKISLKLDRPLINNGINSNHFDSIDMDLNSGLSDIKSIIPERYELDKKFLIFGELVEEEKEKYILEIKKFLE